MPKPLFSFMLVFALENLATSDRQRREADPKTASATERGSRDREDWTIEIHIVGRRETQVGP